MSLVTTHVLDAAAGRPAPGIPVQLETGGQIIAHGLTDVDGRIRDLGPDQLVPGVYRLVFDTGNYLGPEGFFPEIIVSFRITDGAAHHHVPILLSPFAYSTYRGS
ncbi:hydroxyisourate hydrolase [Amycolatopsis pithecellobii]|uniref:5-hydroxyisourate hydrolase n=1 Tax=Amycolatopsis pithecellobii TaxID=664692 RepID=A0A6N7Z2V6_9PSEU|nr:hydroxyisourate hydrolase [Amycolatopsis pithecellobii]MTD55319.1 hydroxyisourate hydrolase [Amycolatopsis pithecellobii]